MSDTVGSEPSPDPDGPARDENAALKKLSEKAVMRISQMKKALMEKTWVSPSRVTCIVPCPEHKQYPVPSIS